MNKNNDKEDGLIESHYAAIHELSRARYRLETIGSALNTLGILAGFEILEITEKIQAAETTLTNVFGEQINRELKATEHTSSLIFAAAFRTIPLTPKQTQKRGKKQR